MTTDKYQAPLLAWWKVGAGRVTTISFPIAGEYSQRVRSWPQYGTLLQTVSRWTMKPDVPAGLSLKYKTEGDSLFIKLYYDQKWNQTFGMSPPALYVHSTKEKDVQLYKWQRLLPGTFGYTLKLKPGERVNGSIVAGSYAIPFGPIISNLDMEWTFDKERIQDLEVLAEQTGGAEHADFSKIWSMETQTQLRNVTSYFYTIALVLFLIELYLSRVGIQYKLKNVEAQRPALLDDLKFDSQEENKTSVDAKDELEENKNELRDNSQSRKDRYKRAKLK